MGTPLLLEAWRRPVTSCLVLLNLLVFYLLRRHGLGYPDVALNYDAVLLRGEWWRLLTAAFSHVDVLHIAFNGVSLWGLGPAEAAPPAGLGTAAYLSTTIILILAPMALVLLVFHVMIQQGRQQEALRHQHLLGYSAVLFGWETVLALRRPTFRLGLMGNAASGLPIAWAPFGSLVLVQLLVPQASWTGHLCGIVVGYLIGWGAFDFLTPYWLACALLWAGGYGVWAARPAFLHIEPEDGLLAPVGGSRSGSGDGGGSGPTGGPSGGRLFGRDLERGEG